MASVSLFSSTALVAFCTASTMFVVHAANPSTIDLGLIGASSESVDSSDSSSDIDSSDIDSSDSVSSDSSIVASSDSSTSYLLLSLISSSESASSIAKRVSTPNDNCFSFSFNSLANVSLATALLLTID